MKYALFLFLTACATSHDYCVDHAANYSSYDECYQEREARRERIHQALSHMGDGLQNNRTVQCTSYNGGDGYIYTNCR
jgi:hypothetical protein